MNKLTRSFISWLIIAGSLWKSACASRAEHIITPVAVRGQPAPGLANGITFSGNFTDVQINDSGEVLFIANVSGPGVNSTNRMGMWTGRPGKLVLVVRTGSQAPEYALGVSFFGLSFPLLPPNGLPAFFARLRGPGISEDAFEPGNDDTLWAAARTEAASRSVESSQGDSIVRAAIGDATPSFTYVVEFPKYPSEYSCFHAKGLALIYGATGAPTFALTIFAWINKNCVFGKGESAVRAPTATSQPVERFGFALLRANQAAAAVAFPDDPAPGTQESFLDIDRRSLVASGRGPLAFVATTSGGKQGIWAGTSTNLRPVALSGTVVPASLATEFGRGTQWGSVSGFAGLGMNAKGEIAFRAALFSGSDYLFAGPPEAPRLAVRFVQPASPDEGFMAAEKIVMNAAGDIAFIGPHTSLREIPGIAGIPGAGVNGLGLTYQHGPPKLILAEGKTAPGLNDGEVISFFYGGGPFMNRHGQVLILAEIGPAVGNQTDQGLWLVDPARGVQLVARGGTQIDAGGGQIRSIEPRSVSFLTTHNDFLSGGEDGRPKPFNDLGQVVFIASWREANGAFGSGVFVAGEVRVLAGKKVGDDIEVAFATALGRKHRVEFRDAVETGAWATLQDGVDGTGGRVVVTDVGAAKLPKRFYRAAVSP